MQFFGICAKRRDKVVSPMHSTGLLGTDWGFSISIARLQLRSAAYHGYSIAFDGHPHSSSIGGGRRRRGRQQQPSAITKRRRYSFFMSPHLAAKRCASEEKQSSKSKCSPWQKTMSPWPVKFCLLSSSPSLLLSIFILVSIRYFLLFIDHCSAPVNGDSSRLGIIEHVGSFNSSKHLGISVKTWCNWLRYLDTCPKQGMRGHLTSASYAVSGLCFYLSS